MLAEVVSSTSQVRIVGLIGVFHIEIVVLIGVFHIEIVGLIGVYCTTQQRSSAPPPR
jgi:hypothetical protein